MEEEKSSIMKKLSNEIKGINYQIYNLAKMLQQRKDEPNLFDNEIAEENNQQVLRLPNVAED